MATFHLCNSSKANNIQPHTDLTRPSPFTIHTNLMTLPNKPESIKFNRLPLTFRTLPNKRPAHILNHIDNIDHPSSTFHQVPLKIGIIGFGNFGRFIAKALKRQGHTVLATSRSDYSDYCRDHGIEYFR